MTMTLCSTDVGHKVAETTLPVNEASITPKMTIQVTEKTLEVKLNLIKDRKS